MERRAGVQLGQTSALTHSDLYSPRPLHTVAEALRLSLGAPLASDIMRTIELERLGFTVAWTAIPPSISPMNRILLAHRPEREVGP